MNRLNVQHHNLPKINLVAAVALVAIALCFCALRKESNFFNECVEEMKATGSPIADSVRFCSGG